MTARRFGGPNSPGGDPRPGSASRIGGAGSAGGKNPFKGRAAASVDIRTLLLFALPTPLLISAFGSIFKAEPMGAIFDLGAYALILFGAFLTREGQKAESAFRRRMIAKPPAFPRKIAGGVCIAAGVAIAVMFGWKAGSESGFFTQIMTTVLFAALALGSHLVAFGVDPMKAKGLKGDGISEAEALRVSEALEKAETYVAEIHGHVATLNDRDLTERVDTMLAAVREMLRMVEEDPRDLNRARRYLGVYLRGARDAAEKFATNNERLNDPAIRGEFVALITDMEDSFVRGRDMLLQDNRTDLEVEIEVLRERLQQEGV